jgi:large subunit ribosomal protein L6
MRTEKIEKKVDIPEGVTATLEGRIIKVKAGSNEVSRSWKNPKIACAIDGDSLSVTAAPATSREKKDIFTLAAHVRNMIRGVTEGHEYELKICSGHFPMNVSVSNGVISVKNFLGEKVPRTYKIKAGADVKVDGTSIKITSPDKETAGDVAASIERLTRITNRDRRIFQDGIYIIMKDGKEIK